MAGVRSIYTGGQGRTRTPNCRETRPLPCGPSDHLARVTAAQFYCSQAEDLFLPRTPRGFGNCSATSFVFSLFLFSFGRVLALVLWLWVLEFFGVR